MSARIVYAQPTLLEDWAEALGWLWVVACAAWRRITRHPLVAGRHEPGDERTVFIVRPAFGANDEYASDLRGLRAPSAEDTAVLPAVDDDYLFCRRPPVLSREDAAYAAAVHRASRLDASDLIGGLR